MVLPVTKFFSRIGPGSTSQGRPLLNTIPISSTQNAAHIGSRNFDYKKFWYDYRTSPELLSVINTLTTDILGDRPEWVAPDGSQLGRNTILKAQRFWRENRGKETVNAWLHDAAVTGDGFLWMSRLTLEQRKEIARRMILKFGAGMTSKERDMFLIKAIQDEDLKKPKAFDYVASSTVTIESNNREILGYVQRSLGQEESFKPEEIIHLRWNTINGFVEGFSPVEALAAEIALLWLVKGNMVAVMENGGAPDQMFIMENEIAGGPNHNYLVDQLTKYKSVRQRHGVLVFTGKVEPKDITGKIEDLQFKELALYITSNIAYAFGMPVTRIPYLIGTAATKGDSGGMSEQGYWNKISEIQDTVEDLLNLQMFESMGWHIKFNRKYKQDEIREANVFSMNTDTVQKMQTILKQKGKSLTDGKLTELLGISQNDLRELTEEEKMNPMERSGMMGQNLLDNLSLEKEPDNRKRADTKRNVANTETGKATRV